MKYHSEIHNEIHINTNTVLLRKGLSSEVKLEYKKTINRSTMDSTTDEAQLFRGAKRRNDENIVAVMVPKL